VASTVRNLHVHFDAAVSGGSYIFTVRKAGASTTVTCTAANGTSGCVDTTNSVAFAAGDLISIQIAQSGGPNSQTGGFTLTLGS
jgi:hypothetical protein